MNLPLDCQARRAPFRRDSCRTPLDEPPVLVVSNGLRVGPGLTKANSVVTDFPTMSAPARRSASTDAESNPVSLFSKIGLPNLWACRGFDHILILSASHRPVKAGAGERSASAVFASARAASRRVVTQAFTSGSWVLMERYTGPGNSRVYPRPAGIDQLYQRNCVNLNQGYIERANSLVNLIN